MDKTFILVFLPVVRPDPLCNGGLWVELTVGRLPPPGGLLI
jgi:hypothetical protein